MKNQLSFILVILFLHLAACSTGTISPTPPPDQPTESVTPPPPEKPARKSLHQRAQWSDLSGWAGDDLIPAWQAFLKSCTVLSKQALWQKPCEAAAALQKPTNTALRDFFESAFIPYQVINLDNSEEGLITGYYEPLLKGSQKPSKRYRHPIYTAPEGLLTIDLGAAHPELKDLRLRGRLDGRKIVPYYTRAEIMNNPKILDGY